MSAAAGTIASACSCYASYSKCLTSNLACAASQLAQAGVHSACKATCPITTDCGPEGKTITFATTTELPGGSTTRAPVTGGATDSNGSPVSGAPGTGTNSDGSAVSGGKTDTNGAPITDKPGSASQMIVGAAAILVACSVALFN